MADPHIKSPMDGWDTITVIIYRSGFILAANCPAWRVISCDLLCFFIAYLLETFSFIATNGDLDGVIMPNVRFARVGIGSSIFHFRRFGI